MINTKNQWQKGFPQLEIQPDMIHVWRCSLDLPSANLENLLGILQPDEFERAKKFYFEKDRNRFIAARSILRSILGLYLNENPDQIKIGYTSFGKPVLVPGSYFQNLHFNLSHSENLALLAIASEGNVGIDIEQIRYDLDIEALASRFFSKEEICVLEKMDAEKKMEVFFQLWTRKEAFLKATGKGLSFPMEHCDVSSADNRNFSPVIIPITDISDQSNWYVMDLEPAKEYMAAIASDRPNMLISLWDYSFNP
jgi:4'-phosphopantetheinyl transferase